jgi:cyanophycin synthetase
MKILKIDILKGPNYWSSNYQRLIAVHLDLVEDLAKFNRKIPIFYQGLNKIFPNIQQRHYCLQHQDEFCQQISLIKTIIRIALELQNLAEMSVSFGRASISAVTGIEQIVFEYQTPKAGRYAAKAAIRICQSLIEYGSYPQTELEQDLKDLKAIRSAFVSDPSTAALLREAESRQIPWIDLSVESLIQLGYGKYQRRLQAFLSDHHSSLGVKLAGDKFSTQALLRKTGFPVPNSKVLSIWNDLKPTINEVGGYPVVIKPLDGKHAKGITLEIDNWERALAAYHLAVQESKFGRVLVEKYYDGRDYRILVVNGKVVAAVERIAAHVIGDGKSNIVQLVEQFNQEPFDGNEPNHQLTRIAFDSYSERVLLEQGYTSQSVPEVGEIVYLKATANLSTGGIALDRTDKIHPENIWLAQRAAKIIGLELAEIELVCLDIGRPLRYSEGAIIGVNAVPELGMYLQPHFGQPRNVAASILDWLYPANTQARIPIITVTGSEGKSIAIDLIAHIFKQVKQVVGYTSRGKTYLGDYEVNSLERSQFQSSELILQDPTVDVAVLKVTDSQIRESGLSFDRCDVGVILNLSPTDEETERCYRVVTEAVSDRGYVVLNVDLPGVEAFAKQVRGTVVYFSLNPDNPLLQKHLFQRGLAAVYQNGYLSLLQDQRIITIELAVNVPLITRRPVPLALSLALAASLVAYVQGVGIPDISTALRTFQIPRKFNYSGVNLIDLGKVHILVACPDDLTKTVGEFVLNWQQGERIGVIGAKGDRSKADLIELGKLSAEIFDRLIVKEDDEQEKKNQGEVAELISRGIEQKQSNFQYELILDEFVAINTAITQATYGSLIVILSEQVCQAISLLQQPSFPALTALPRKLSL